jgi:hypothetical protein
MIARHSPTNARTRARVGLLAAAVMVSASGCSQSSDAPGAASGASVSGALVFEQSQIVVEPNTAQNRRLGYGVALSGDRLAMAATNLPGSAGAGDVVMFNMNPDTGRWQYSTTIPRPVVDEFDVYDGSGVVHGLALVGDWLFVGAPGKTVVDGDTTYGAVGEVRVYKNTGGNTWSLVQTISPPGALDAGFWFGTSVAANADWLWISAEGDAERSEGKIYVYQRALDTWSLAQTFPEVGSYLEVEWCGYEPGMDIDVTTAVAWTACDDVADGPIFFELEGGVWKERAFATFSYGTVLEPMTPSIDGWTVLFPARGVTLAAIPWIVEFAPDYSHTVQEIELIMPPVVVADRPAGAPCWSTPVPSHRRGIWRTPTSMGTS